jgi:hypothetical protein
MSPDHRQAAQERIADLTRLLQSSGDRRTAPIVNECESLSRAIAAFHMEGIRFRIFNVDRLLRGYVGSAPGESATRATSLLEEARRHLEAAGFHTRSHQAPT